MTPEEILVRDGARKILRDYENPPAEGVMVPRAWVEENAAELLVAACVEEVMLGDLGNWKPEGLLNGLGIEPGDEEAAVMGDPITDGLRRAPSGGRAAIKPPEEDIDSCVIVTSGPNEEVIVRKSDLLHCLQVAVWRAGLLEQPSLLRLKEALGIGEDESVPKPAAR